MKAAKKAILARLKHENELLKETNKKQLSAFEDFNNRFGTEEGEKVYKERIIRLKEKFKLSKEILKSYETKVKAKNMRIVALEDKILKIKEKCERIKRMDKAFERNEIDLDEVETRVAELEKQMEIEEKIYKEKVEEAVKSTSASMEQIKELKMKVLRKEQEKRIENIKIRHLRELSRNKISPGSEEKTLPEITNKMKAKQALKVKGRIVTSGKPKETKPVMNSMLSKKVRVKSANQVRGVKQKTGLIKESLFEIEKLKMDLRKVQKEKLIFI